jgi:hypothetical protein
LNIYLVPYLSYEEQGDLGELRLQKFPKKKKCPKYMSEDTVKSFFDGDRPGDDDFDCHPSKDADVWILEYGDAEQAQTCAGSTDNYNYEGYFGNEASDTSFYVRAALFIEAPYYSESRGECVAATASSGRAKKRLKA